MNSLVIILLRAASLSYRSRRRKCLPQTDAMVMPPP
jgi:hypothetical protein